MCVMRYLLDMGYFCPVNVYKLHLKSPGFCCTGATLERHHGYAMLWLCYGCVVTMLWLHQPGERMRYGFYASRWRVNVSAAPTAPRVFSQPLS